MLFQIFTIIAPVFVIALIGYIWQKRALPFDNNMVMMVVSYIAAPSMLLHAALTTKIAFDAIARIAVASVVLIAAMTSLGWVVTRLFKLPQRVYLPAVIFSNAGNMGLPLCLFAFGDVGLVYAVAFNAMQSALQFSLGDLISSGKFSWRNIVANPLIIAVVVAGILVAAHVTLPLWIENTLGALGDLTAPLMLLSLGTSLAKLRVAGLGAAFGISVLRLAGGFGAGLAVVWALQLDGAARGSVIIQSSMPVAVLTYMFALRYNNQPEEVAAMVFISTIISFLTLPLLMAYVLSLN